MSANGRPWDTPERVLLRYLHNSFRASLAARPLQRGKGKGKGGKGKDKGKGKGKGKGKTKGKEKDPLQYTTQSNVVPAPGTSYTPCTMLSGMCGP
eukprot:485451-Amphidinium_carterae.3